MSSPSTSVVTDFIDDEHIEFIKSCQGVYDLFRSSSDAEPHGSQKRWVFKHVMGEFQTRFGSASREVFDVRIQYISIFAHILTNASLQKIDRYLRNHSCHNSKKASRRMSAMPNPTTRAVPWLQVMANNNKDLIDIRVNALRDSDPASIEVSSDHLDRFRRARQDVADSLPKEKIREYQELALAGSQFRKAPPTPGVVFRYFFACLIIDRELTKLL